MRRQTLAAIVLGLGLGLCAMGEVGVSEAEETAVAVTKHFAFYSDFESNLHDALLEAGRDRNFDRQGLFEAGEEVGCFEELPASSRLGWQLAVAYYAEIVSPERWDQNQQFWIRMDLSGVEELPAERDMRFVAVARGVRQAAAPAYGACRWPIQDEEGRDWIAALVERLAVHEEAIAARLGELYDRPLSGLPMRVDVVQTVNWSGATTILLDPVGGHIQASSGSYRGLDALEIVFHESSHTLMGHGHPVRNALASAAERLEIELPRDLWHGVLFYQTGEIVRQALAEKGSAEDSRWVPLMFSGDIFGKYHTILREHWTQYLDGRSSLEEAAEALLRAVGEAEQ